jgi:hypothetical protein
MDEMLQLQQVLMLLHQRLLDFQLLRKSVIILK